MPGGVRRRRFPRVRDCGAVGGRARGVAKVQRIISCALCSRLGRYRFVFDTGQGQGAASYLDRDTGERCITDGLPITPLQFYNLNFQIFQTPQYVAILAEMYHDYRIIPLDGRAHGSIPQWLGDGRGRWEGDTLVVDTTEFADETEYVWAWPWRTPSPTFHLVERFRRVDRQTIDYQFTIEDPSLLTRPLTAPAPLTKTEGAIYEYACHEGNYGLRDILNVPSDGGAAPQPTAPR